jgi:putative tryptophan/tyrosine transport system substrate-binding protein
VWSRRGSSPRIVMLLCGEENLCEVAKAPGAVMSYGPNQIDMWKRAAIFVDKTLRGSKPADMPVERPTKFELVINLNSAKSIGLTVPSMLLVGADEVIE